MEFLVKVQWSSDSVVSQLFQGKPNGIWAGFQKPIFQAYDCFEEKDSVCHRSFLKQLFLATCNLKQILTMIVRIELL